MHNRLYVGNFSFNTGGDELCDAFEKYGEVTDVHLVADRLTRQPVSFGFVEMDTCAAVSAAIAAVAGFALDGRAPRVNEAQEREGGGGNAGGLGRAGKRAGW
jgi:RNA recognition motif-containing protein